MQVSCKEEDQTMDAVAAISAIDPKIVRKVFEGLSVYAAMEAYKGSQEFTYPFVGKVAISYYDEMETPTKTVKKASGSLSVFDNFAEFVGEARQGKFIQIKEFIQNRFKRQLKDLVEQ
jgi:hypothetical protein